MSDAEMVTAFRMASQRLLWGISQCEGDMDNVRKVIVLFHGDVSHLIPDDFTSPARDLGFSSELVVNDE